MSLNPLENMRSIGCSSMYCLKIFIRVKFPRLMMLRLPPMTRGLRVNRDQSIPILVEDVFTRRRHCFHLHLVQFVFTMRRASFFFGVYSWLVKVLGQFSIIYFRGLGLRIGVRVWVRVRVGVRVWIRVRVRVRVRVSVVLWSG